MQGYFTQSSFVLCRSAPALEALSRALEGFNLLGRLQPPEEESHWAFGGQALVLEMESAEARMIIDVIDRIYPDQMGDPSNAKELFEAWTQGAFGPGVFPGNLRRAAQQVWSWKEGAEHARDHRAFVRLRCSRLAPEGEKIELGDPSEELLSLTQVAAAILEGLEEALCLFNPNGEVLRSLEQIDAALIWSQREQRPPLELWCNLRAGKLDPLGDWGFMDCLGLGQLGLPDIELCLPGAETDFGRLDPFIRALMEYLLEQGGEILKSGHSLEDPEGRVWRVLRPQEGLMAPPRPMIRLYPEEAQIPEGFLWEERPREIQP